ncbi:MAG: phytoene desaturase [Weeksellaceae bacterium]|nr:phytoene desaturase [Weeksellaceae bacterium]
MISNQQKIAIIGGGISGLSAACYAAKAGYEVHIYEKNSTLGGRARQFSTSNGYTFDMGPSWYWMPDIIENFFQDFNKKSSDYYDLISLNPQFEIIFPDQSIHLPESFEDIFDLFESLEKGAGKKLEKFMNEAERKYDIGMNNFVQKPSNSWLEFISLDVIVNAMKLDLLTNYRSYVASYFKHPYLQAIMEFPVIFLGASPKEIPALYSLMNYGGYKLGTWYPTGGFFSLIKAMESIALELGVKIHLNSTIEKIEVEDKKVKSLKVNDQFLSFDFVISSSDYNHTETLLEPSFRNYSEEYWKSRTFAPSCLIFYLGINEIIPNLTHHTLFFEHDLDLHVEEIYKDSKWPTKPLFYACCPSKTDDNVAPKGHENLFLLMPIAIDIEDSEEIRLSYLDQMIERLEKKTGVKDLKSKIDYQRSYCINDFKLDYNAYGGNAYGLANTLNQTAVLKPSVKNRKVKNLIYTGQLTVPGPGVPPSIISGKIAANEIKI